jgi:cytochrome c-type biogenesis protein CcmH
MPTMDERAETLRRQLRELKALHDDGTLTTEAHDRARAPLERELVDRVTRGPLAAPAPVRPSTALSAGLLAAVLAVAIGGYAVTGAPEHAGHRPGSAATAPPMTADGPAPVTDQQVLELVEQVAQRVKERPDDATGWALLARAYAAIGRQADAIPAFQKAVALAPKDASLMADYADTLVAQNQGVFNPEALAWLQRALAVEPENIKALALDGSAAYDRGDFAAAVRQWTRVERALPPDSPMLPQLRATIAEARQRGGVAEPTEPTAAAPAVAAAAVASLSGRVTLSPALQAQAAPGDTVFIVARAAEGPRMPLAVLRKQVKDLPADFTLDDGMAMTPAAKISDHPRIIVSARVSKSGDATPRAGDLAGQSAVVAPGAKGVAVQIVEVVNP